MGKRTTGKKREEVRLCKRVAKGERKMAIIDALNIDSRESLAVKARKLGISVRGLYNLRKIKDAITKEKKNYKRRSDCLLTDGQELELHDVLVDREIRELHSDYDYVASYCSEHFGGKA